MNQIFGEVFYCYTRADAINGGVLVDLSAIYPDECCLYRHPIACTAAVWAMVELATAGRKHFGDVASIVWDIVYMSQKAIVSRPDNQTVLFVVIIPGSGLKRSHTLKAVCHAGYQMEPVITIMLPNED